jgi:hypothetical protein
VRREHEPQTHASLFSFLFPFFFFFSSFWGVQGGFFGNRSTAKQKTKTDHGPLNGEYSFQKCINVLLATNEIQ